MYVQIPGEVIPFPGYLVEEFLHSNYALLVLPTSLHVLPPLSLQLFSPLAQVHPASSKSPYLLQGRRDLSICQPTNGFIQMGYLRLSLLNLLEELLQERLQTLKSVTLFD